MDSVRNATFRIAFRRHMSLCAPFAASRWTDICLLLLSQNGNTHFGSSKSSLQNTTRGFPYIRKWYNSLRAGKSLDRHMAASSILKWQYSLRVGKSSLQNTTRGFLYIRKWKNSTELDKSKKINIILM